MVKAFPPVVRFSGLSFSYNVAYAIFGGLTPMIVSLLLKESPMGPAYYVAIICGVAIAAVTTQSGILVDIALVGGLLGFLTLSTVARYVGRRGL